MQQHRGLLYSGNHLHTCNWLSHLVLLPVVASAACFVSPCPACHQSSSRTCAFTVLATHQHAFRQSYRPHDAGQCSLISTCSALFKASSRAGRSGAASSLFAVSRWPRSEATSACSDAFASRASCSKAGFRCSGHKWIIQGKIKCSGSGSMSILFTCALLHSTVSAHQQTGTQNTPAAQPAWVQDARRGTPAFAAAVAPTSVQRVLPAPAICQDEGMV
jgi:hypothetical protein